MADADDVVKAQLTVLASPPFASFFVHMLEDEGVKVEWTPPVEERGAGEIIQQVLIDMVATGSLAAIRYAAKRFVDWTHDRAKVDIKVEGPPRHAR